MPGQRMFIAHPASVDAGRAVSDTGRGRVPVRRETAQVSVGGVSFAMTLQTRCWMDRVIFRHGTREEEDAAFALSLLRPGAQAVDVGANAGFYRS